MAKLRIPAMLLLFVSAALIEVFRLSSLSALANADIWWHLSSGLWMLDHHAFPHSGLFSQSASLPWIATSWAYDLLLALVYKIVGLRAIPVLLMFLNAGLAVVTFLLAGGLRGRFWVAFALSAIAQYILGAIPPGPGYFSALFFGIELLLLLEARRSGSDFPPLLLPLVFLLWANVHVQFVYGVGLLILFVIVVACERWWHSASNPELDLRAVLKIVGVTTVATLLTPYLYRPYAVFFVTTFNSGNQYLSEFRALGFRKPQDYLLLLLAMSAFLTLGLRRSRDLFQIGLLAGCLGLSFYAQRDAWLVALASLAVIGEALTGARSRDTEISREKLSLSRQIWIAACASVVILMIAAFLRIPHRREVLVAKAGTSYPVAACDYIREHRLPQPLFNAYEWGGFLTWYLPEYPVAIDGRADLYGGDTVAEYSKVMNADVPYTEYPAVAGAKTILLPKNAIMAAGLSSVPIFKVAYSDDVAIVLTRNDASE
jgi:hypothetical protein